MSDGHVTHKAKDYEVTLHPAWASRCVVKNGDGECVVYKQDKPHQLNGEKHPRKHKVVLKGGPYNRDITIEIDDPNHALAGFSLRLYGEGYEPGSGVAADVVETVEGDNTATTCPPWCDQDPPTPTP